MSQHDFSIANQGFPSFRADLNSGLEALATNSSGATAPATTYAYQFWYDTANDLLKMRNGDNDAWITLAAFDQANDEWEVRSAVIQAVDAAGVEIKTDDGTTRLDIADDGTVTIPGDFVVQGTVTGIFTDKIAEGNSSVEVIDSGTGRIEFTVDGSEAMRIDDNGNVGIGTSTPTGIDGDSLPAGKVLEIESSFNKVSQVIIGTNDTAVGANQIMGQIGFKNKDNNGDRYAGIKAVTEATNGVMSLDFHTGASSFIDNTDPAARITTNKFLQFDSGYGSVATAYGCRAWVNFDGTGTVSIRDSGNVSSITDNGAGDYTINLNNALPDANGSATYGGIRNTGVFTSLSYHQQIWITSTTTVRARTGTAGTGFGDHDVVSIAVFR